MHIQKYVCTPEEFRETLTLLYHSLVSIECLVIIYLTIT